MEYQKFTKKEKKKMLRKANLLILVVFTIFTVSVFAQSKKTSWSKEVTIIASKPNEKVSVDGDLAKGKIIEEGKCFRRHLGI